MNMRDTATAYGRLSRYLHWLLFILIAAQFLLALSFDWWPKHSNAKHTAVMLHESIGILILVVGVVFILWRWRNPKPSLRAYPAWQRGLALVVHTIIYIAVIAQALFGLTMVMTFGHTVPFFGWFDVPQFIPTDKNTGRVFGTLHAITGWWVLLIALAIHLIATLYHQFVRKDRVFRRMLLGDELN